MTAIITGALLLTGVLFMLLAAIGLIRMPDLYLRMSATTKATTLGAGSILLSAAIHFNELGVSSRAIATIIFILLTAPVAAHMLGRAAFSNGVPLWQGTLYNEWEKSSGDNTTQDTPSVFVEPELAEKSNSTQDSEQSTEVKDP